MKDLFKKHWITLLGAIFTFMAFGYLFDFAVDQGWISNGIKIGLGLLAGAGFVVGGAAMQQRGAKIVDQILSGLGVALLYTTFTFAGIVFDIWDPMTVFIVMIAVTLGLSVYSFKFDLRVLMNLAILGALISPLMMEPRGDQVFTLFLYLLVINSIYFFMSVWKRWTELRLIPFAGTWVLYTAYYFYYRPETWEVPFLYAASAFIFYVIGFMVSSWKEDKKFDGLNLYLGILNGCIFALWSLAILTAVVSFSVVLAGMGAVYLITSLIVYQLQQKYTIPFYTKFFAGILFLLVSGAQIGSGSELKQIISVYMWTFISLGVLIVGQIKKLEYLKVISAVIWVITGTYWYTVTWESPVGEWFGTFIPVLNWSGMAWLVLAILGFYFSVKVQFEYTKDSSSKANNSVIANFFSISSHLIVGGLLTFQIDNLWEYNKITFIDLWLALSVSWGIYALLLFVWGAYSKQAVFRWFGSVVLVLVAVKTIFINMSSAETIFKVLALLILGVITFTISYINNKWNGNGQEKLQEVESIKEMDSE
ncbi:MAG: DUF2339 domain-containing protein [Clostridia bacterium]|nr:DUF2339 domain-containing protein [Clostridia bacterium]